MQRDELQESLAPGGAHDLLGGLAGEWEGTARTWFEPGKLADESPIAGTIRSVLGGRFVVHEYRGSLIGEPLEGIAILGYDLHRGRWQTAWIDTCHTGTQLMLAEGGGDEPSVVGGYPDPSGGSDWGWRTEVELADADTLVITHFNVTPAGEEAKAVEIEYRRRS